MKRTALAIVVVLLAACGSKPQAPPPRAQPSSDATSRTGAAATPNDSNVVTAPIPTLLLDAQRAPYAEPIDGTCAGLQAQVVALDALLGADLDVPPTAGNPSLIERGPGPAGQTATQQVRSAAESVVPPRSWVRRPSGSERYSRDVAAAIAAGTVRRSYLKGMGAVRGCRAPAAPATAEQP